MDFSIMTDDEFSALGRAYMAEFSRRKARRKQEGLDAKRFKAVQHNNTSGVKGVTFNKHAGKWQAKIGVGGRKVKHLGYFNSMEDAASARAAAEVEYWGGRQ